MINGIIFGVGIGIGFFIVIGVALTLIFIIQAYAQHRKLKSAIHKARKETNISILANSKNVGKGYFPANTR